jgi:hypothetical protein
MAKREFKPTYLYVKTHLKTGLKYFGKTITDPFLYIGSGIRWRRHLDKHGNDVKTEIIGYYTSRQECEAAALNFSKKHDIVKNKNWANLMEENGFTGGAYIFSDSEKQKLSATVKKKQWDTEKGKIRKQQLSKQLTGENNPAAKQYKIIKETGEIVFIKCLKSFCRKHDLIWNTVKDNVNKGKIVRRGIKDTSFFQSKTKQIIAGWEIIELNKKEII